MLKMGIGSLLGVYFHIAVCMHAVNLDAECSSQVYP